MMTSRYIGWFAGTLVSVALLTACSGEDVADSDEDVASSQVGLSGRLLRDAQEGRQKVALAKERGTVLTPEALVEILQPPLESANAIRERMLQPDMDWAAAADELGDPADLAEGFREYHALLEDVGIDVPFEASIVDQQCAGEHPEQCAEAMAPDMSAIGGAPGGNYSWQWYACQGTAGAWVIACAAACTTTGPGAPVCGAACGVVYNHMNNLCGSAYEAY